MLKMLSGTFHFQHIVISFTHENWNIPKMVMYGLSTVQEHIILVYVIWFVTLFQFIFITSIAFYFGSGCGQTYNLWNGLELEINESMSIIKYPFQNFKMGS